MGKGKEGGEDSISRQAVSHQSRREEWEQGAGSDGKWCFGFRETDFFFFYTKHKQFQTVIREYCQLVCFRNMRNKAAKSLVHGQGDKIATQHSQQAGKMRSEFSMTQELPMVSIKGTDGICFSFLASLFELWERLVCKIRILL